MKSENQSSPLTFEELTLRLRAFIRLQINGGEFTERSLARVFHISQPHLHNMLKGVRRLSAEFSNQIMFEFQITILDLISAEEICNYLDEKNPEWLTQAAKRKPPVQPTLREGDPRAPWREPRSGS